MRRRTAARSICVALAAIAASRAASANVGRSTLGGRLAGEPDGIRDIAILGEALVIDLRPLALRSPADDRAQVWATYQLDNRAAGAADV